MMTNLKARPAAESYSHFHNTILSTIFKSSIHFDSIHKCEEIAFMHNNKIVSFLCLLLHANCIFFTAVGGSQAFYLCVPVCVFVCFFFCLFGFSRALVLVVISSSSSSLLFVLDFRSFVLS